MSPLYLILIISAAYLIGSISSAILVCRIFKLPDPRSMGSNNPGATNVMRIGGKWPAAITFFGDALKGFLPVYIARLLNFPNEVCELTLLAAFLGHLFPIFFKFKGGKGLATYIGGAFALSSLLGVGMILAWVSIFFLFRISSLAALFAVTFAPFLSWTWTKEWSWDFAILVLISTLTIWTHRENIKRLIRGQEKRI